MNRAVFKVAVPLLLLAFACSEARIQNFRLGADQILEEPYLSWIRGKRVGLITNQTGTTSDLRFLATLLKESPEVKLTALFSPEHGLFGQAQAGAAVADGPKVFSLYGEQRAPTPAMLENVDVLIYDIQDVGVRFYTYISTLHEAMKSAAARGIPFLVLDRPDPIGGRRVEGPVLEEAFESFVGIHPLPLRYGMTPGELALLFKEEGKLNLVLWVVPMQGWRRDDDFGSLGLEWIAPSPNMPTPRTAEIYPGTCLIEATNLSEGRGTTRPFELIGAPWLNAEALCGILNSHRLPGVYFRVQPFTPTFSKYQGQPCQGVQIHVLDSRTFMPIESALFLIREVLNLHPEEFKFEPEVFDRLVGNDWIRRMLTESRAVDAVVERWKPGLAAFELRRRQHLLY